MKTFGKFTKKAFLWTLAGFFALIALAFLSDGGILCGLFAAIFVAVILPIDKWQTLINKVIKKKLKLLISVSCVLLCFITVPATEPVDANDSIVSSSPHITTATEDINTTGTESVILDTSVPTTQFSTQSTAETTTTPTVELTTPTTEPTTEPATKPTTEPATKPTTEPATKPAVKPTTEPATKPATKPTTEPATKPATTPTTNNTHTDTDCDYVANTSTKKFHHPDCSSVKKIKDENRWDYNGSRDELIDMGYDPCGRCHP